MLDALNSLLDFHIRTLSVCEATILACLSVYPLCLSLLFCCDIYLMVREGVNGLILWAITVGACPFGRISSRLQHNFIALQFSLSKSCYVSLSNWRLIMLILLLLEWQIM